MDCLLPTNPSPRRGSSGGPTCKLLLSYPHSSELLLHFIVQVLSVCGGQHIAFDRIARSRCSEPAWHPALTGLPHRALDRRGLGYSKSHLQSGHAHTPVRHGCSSCQSAPRHCQTVFCEPGRCGPKSGAAKLVTGSTGEAGPVSQGRQKRNGQRRLVWLNSNSAPAASSANSSALLQEMVVRLSY